MKIATPTLLTLIILGLAPSAQAQTKPSLPVGEWAAIISGQPSCPWDIKIEPDRIIHKVIDVEGVCKITSLKRMRSEIEGKYDCQWPQGGGLAGDADPDGFSLAVKSPTRIVFNNQTFGLCPPKDKAQ